MRNAEGVENKKGTVMKRVMVFTVGVVILACSAGYGDQIWDRPEYKPSTDLTLGAWSTVWGGVEGYVIDDPFQINLLYQAGIENSAIDALNDYLSPGWTYNFSDNEHYVFAFDAAGNLPVYTYPDINDSSDPLIQWTLTGWHQTIFAGSMEYEYDGEDLVSIFFRVDPAQGYRPFPNDPPVNDVEVFSGIVLSEVVGYRYYVNSPVVPGEGSILRVELVPVPEPATMGIFGLGLMGLAAMRVRRRTA